MTALFRPRHSSLRTTGDKYHVDHVRKLGSIIANEIIIHELYCFLEEYYSMGSTRLLDVGAGTKPYAPIYESFFDECVSVDIPYSSYDIGDVDVFAPAEDLPFPRESFDCVICTEVLEHCADPGAALCEIHRVLKTGGRAFVTTPFLVPLHAMPDDYYRYTPSALKRLAEEAGLTVANIQPRGDYFAVILAFALYPWAKLWQVISNRVKVALYHPYNPLVFFPIVVPQLVYVSLWKRARRLQRSPLNRLHEKLSYITLGYVTVLVKLNNPDGATTREDEV